MSRARVSLGLVVTLIASAVWLSSAGAAGDVRFDAQPSCSDTSPPATSSPSPGASPTPCPTSPSPTATEPVGRTGRIVSLHPSRNQTLWGRSITLFGFVESSPRCSERQVVELDRRFIGPGGRWRDLRTTATNGSGRFEERIRVYRNAEYRAVLRRTPLCGRGESTSRLVNVRVKVVASLTDATPERGTNFRIYGRVRPDHRSTEIKLQRLKGRRWVTLFRQELSDRSTFSFFPLAGWEGDRRFRVRWPRADFDHVAGSSRVLIVRSHG